MFTLQQRRENQVQGFRQNRIRILNQKISEIGGETLGWNMKDHQVFVSIMHQYNLDSTELNRSESKKLEKFCRDVIQKVPTLTEFEKRHPGLGLSKCREHYT